MGVWGFRRVLRGFLACCLAASVVEPRVVLMGVDRKNGVRIGLTATTPSNTNVYLLEKFSRLQATEIHTRGADFGTL